MSLRSPLSHVLGLGSAKDGTWHFQAQRMTAVALVLLGAWFAWSLASLEDMTYLTVVRFIRVPLHAVLLILFSLTLAWHSLLGIQVVIEDYVHALGRRAAMLLLSRCAHAFVAATAAYAILLIGSGR